MFLTIIFSSFEFLFSFSILYYLLVLCLVSPQFGSVYHECLFPVSPGHLSGSSPRTRWSPPGYIHSEAPFQENPGAQPGSLVPELLPGPSSILLQRILGSVGFPVFSSPPGLLESTNPLLSSSVWQAYNLPLIQSSEWPRVNKPIKYVSK